MPIRVSRIQALVLIALGTVLSGAGLTACSNTTQPATQPPSTTSVIRPDKSYYLPMRDGTRIAVSLYFPEGEVPASPVPTILVQTRYGRAGIIRRFGRFRNDGYVIASVDTRGSTASFGPRRVDIGPEEVADMDEIIGHLAEQEWSNGIVFAQGVSYMADTADIATSRPAPALKGAIVRQVDFDVFLNLFYPGGVGNNWFLQGWGEATKAMDEGRSQDGKLNCLQRAEDCDDLWPVLDRVDSDADFRELRQALAGRDRWEPDDYAGLTYIDDKGQGGYTFFDSSPSSHLEGVRAQAKPAQIWGSWMDAGTARAALSRYISAPEVPMEIWITANDHSNRQFADPRAPGVLDPRPSLDAQHDIMTDFYEQIMNGKKIDRQINYFVLGADTFKTTKVWPPANVVPVTYYLAEGNTLNLEEAAPGKTTYQVDFSAGTGDTTRWSTQGGDPPAYPDRRSEDEKLVVFDSEPVETALEIVGDPVISLYVSAATSDPVFHVYLEFVAPDGSVSYVTEGILRAIHRAPADPATLPYDMGAAPHSFRREDALAVTPGDTMKVEFALNPVAARLNKGDRIRVAVAGADKSYFERYSNGEDEIFTIEHGGATPSTLVLPVRAWSPPVAE
jgi:putative CocE/NonD family hydrolase